LAVPVGNQTISLGTDVSEVRLLGEVPLCASRKIYIENILKNLLNFILPNERSMINHIKNIIHFQHAVILKIIKASPQSIFPKVHQIVVQ